MPERKSPRRAHPALMGLNAAAEYCDVSPKTIRRWIAAGRLPAVRVGPRLIKVAAADLAAILQPTGGAV